MRNIRNIVESNLQPNRTNVGWLHNNTLKFFTNGEWKEVGGGKNAPASEPTSVEVNEDKSPKIDVVVDEDKLGTEIDSSLEEGIKACAMIIILRTNQTTKDKYHVIYTRMDSDDNVFVNVGLNEENKLAASVLYLNANNHTLTFD